VSHEAMSWPNRSFDTAKTLTNHVAGFHLMFSWDPFRLMLAGLRSALLTYWHERRELAGQINLFRGSSSTGAFEVRNLLNIISVIKQLISRSDCSL